MIDKIKRMYILEIVGRYGFATLVDPLTDRVVGHRFEPPDAEPSPFDYPTKDACEAAAYAHYVARHPYGRAEAL